MQVSVVIPVYNAGDFVSTAVDSALNQAETSEVLLAEDGSEDNSLEICKYIASKYDNVKVFRHPDGGNRGASASRNLGIMNASFDYIAFLDADDWYLPGRFSTAKQMFAEDTRIDGVYDAVGVYFENELVKKEWFRRNKFEITTLTRREPPEGLFKALLDADKGYIHLNGLVLRKQAFKKSGVFYQQLELVEDTAFCIKAAATTRLVPGSLTEPVAMRRLHGDNSIFGPMWRNRRQQIVLMWRTLLDWAIENKLPPAQIDLLADCYLAAGERGRGDNRIMARAFLRWKVLGEVFIKHPGAITEKYYWRHMMRACDFTKLRYLVTGVPET